MSGRILFLDDYFVNQNSKQFSGLYRWEYSILIILLNLISSIVNMPITSLNSVAWSVNITLSSLNIPPFVSELQMSGKHYKGRRSTEHVEWAPSLQGSLPLLQVSALKMRG
jgi:hypothetical protein